MIAADHPAQDWSRPTGRGQIRGLLVCDALARREQTVLPQAHEIWTHPQLRVLDDRVRLYADGAAYDADRPAREWPIGVSGAPTTSRRQRPNVVFCSPKSWRETQ